MTSPTFYILMRNDLDSMNPGKAIAQATHAASMFENRMKSLVEQTQDPLFENLPEREAQKIVELVNLYDEWKGDRGFGTTITLSVNISQLERVMRYGNSLRDQVLDPTYPIRDGQVTHLIPLVTCAYVFRDRANMEPDNRDYEFENARFPLFP